MKLSILQAKWQLNLLRSDDIPELATQILETGLESPALIELAGLISPDRWEVTPLIEEAFSQASLRPISNEAAQWRLAYETAREIVDGRVMPLEGAVTLWSLANDLQLPEALRYFVYLAADYGEGPRDPENQRAWFDAKIVESARELLRMERPDEAPSLQADV
jgi:hypothetical protein